MSTHSRIDPAGEALPEGAVMPGAAWVRAALQVNPFEYVGNPSPRSQFADEAAYNSALLDECERLGVGMLAVTDHWCASSAAGLIAAGVNRGVTVLPGFEANSSEGVHLLVIFEFGTDLDQITQAIGACAPKPGDPHALADKGLAEIAQLMSNLGALVIPAHVNIHTSGLLSRLKGRPLEAAVRNEHIDALGISPAFEPLGDQPQILANKAPYNRHHPLVAVHADDISDPEALGSEGGTTWFRMTTPGLEGLRHAIRTPQTRVRLSNPEPTRGARVRRVSWVGGFLGGQSFEFADDLSALIGGRGTGKSTVIESIRYALELPPIGPQAQLDHSAVVQNVIKSATTIRVQVDVTSPAESSYVIERTVPNAAIVLDASGSPTELQPRDILGPIEVFGQHELAELAQDKVLMAELVRRVAAGEPIDADQSEIVSELAENRGQLSKVEKEQAELEENLADLPRLEEQARTFEASDIGSKLQQQTDLNSEVGVFTETAARLEAARRGVEGADLTAVAEVLRAPLVDTSSLERKENLDQAASALESAANAIDRARESIASALGSSKAQAESSLAAWKIQVEPLRRAHESVFRELIDAGHSPDKYVATKQNLDKLAKRSEQRGVLARRRTKLLDHRANLLRRLEADDNDRQNALNTAIREVNGATSGAVVVKPIANPDRTRIKSVIDKHFNTQRTQIMAAIEADLFSTRVFVEAIRQDPSSLETFGIRGAQAKTLLEHGESLLRELEEHSVGRAVDVFLNVARPGAGKELKRLDELSKGQRATALLLLLLGSTTGPLIIDQPEDDLDNRFIYDGIVTKLRELKGERQLIVSTHNANIPVLGDAELVVTLEGDGNRGWPVEGGTGSIDTKSVRDHAEALLEGGRDAFQARHHLYRF